MIYQNKLFLTLIAMWVVIITIDVLDWEFHVRNGTAWGNFFWSLVGVFVVIVLVFIRLAIKEFSNASTSGKK